MSKDPLGQRGQSALPLWEAYSFQNFPCYHLSLASLQSKEPMHWISLFISYLVIKQKPISFPFKIVFHQTAWRKNAPLLRLQHQIDVPVFWNSVQRSFCIHSIYFCNPQYAYTPAPWEALSCRLFLRDVFLCKTLMFFQWKTLLLWTYGHCESKENQGRMLNTMLG